MVNKYKSELNNLVKDASSLISKNNLDGLLIIGGNEKQVSILKNQFNQETGNKYRVIVSSNSKKVNNFENYYKVYLDEIEFINNFH